MSDNTEDINVLNNTTPPVVEVPKEQERINVSNIPPKSIGERELDDTVLTETSTNTIENKTFTSPIINTGVSGTAIDTDGTLAANSDTLLASQKATKTYVDANAGGTTGWTTVSDTWVYASASTFTIAGVDRTLIYTKGTKLKFTQTTAKYAVVASSSFSSDTTVTIIVTPDYTIANAAITLPYYSYSANPQGYPGTFTFATTVTGISATTVDARYFSVQGNQIVLYVNMNQTSNATDYTFPAPVANAGAQPTVVQANVADNGAFLAGSGTASIAIGGVTVTLNSNGSGSVWTNTAAKAARFVLPYFF